MKLASVRDSFISGQSGLSATAFRINSETCAGAAEARQLQLRPECIIKLDDHAIRHTAAQKMATYLKHACF